MAKKIKSLPSGLFTAVGTVVLISLIAALMGGWEAIWNLVPDNSNPVGTTLAFVVIDVFSAIGLGVLVRLISKPSKSALADVFNNMEGNYNFRMFLCAAVLEEIYARWLFLGVLPTLLNPTPLVWWTLLLVGNGSWALIHLLNFSSKKRRIIWILPQFVGGLIFTVVYVKFGFLAAVYCHLGSNALILSMHKLEDVVEKDMFTASYCAIASLAAMLLMFFTSPNFKGFELPLLMDQLSTCSEVLRKYNIYDWIGVSVLTTFFLKTASILFLYDCGSVEENGKPKDAPAPWELCLGLGLLTLIIGGAYSLMRVFSPSIGVVTLLCSLGLCCLFRTNSGSGAARNFWLTVPKFLVLGLAFEYGGLAALAASIGSIFLLHIPLFFLERRVAE